MMNYAISVLKKKSEEHKQVLNKLEEELSGDLELQADYEFIKNDMENQKSILLELQNAINILLTVCGLAVVFNRKLAVKCIAI